MATSTWRSGKDSDRFIRRHEKESLDKYYRGLAFWRTPPEQRASSVLAAFDALHLALPVFTTDATSVWDHKLIEDGLSHCLRWIASEGDRLGCDSAHDGETFARATECLMAGGTYQTLCDFYALYSQGVVKGEVASSKDSIRFSYVDPDLAFVNASGVVENWSRIHRGMPSYAKKIREINPRAIKKLAMDSCTLCDGRVLLAQPAALRNTDLQTLSSAEVDTFWLPLSESADLGGFDVSDLSRLWRVLRAWSYLTLIRFGGDHYGKTSPPSFFPTQVVNEGDFISLLEEHSGLGSDILEKIIDRLSFDGNNRKADIHLTPLIRENGCVMWSPRVIISSLYLRNTLKATARTPAFKPIVDTLIGSLERPMLRRIHEILTSNGYQCKLGTEVSCREERGDIDVVAWSSRAKTDVLLIEAKFVLPADEVNEVKDLTEKLIRGKDQILKCMTILDKMPLSQKQALFRFVPWSTVNRTFLLVVNNDGLPNHTYDNTEIPTIDLTSLENHVRRSDLRKPERLWQAACDRDWLAPLATAERDWKPIRFGEMTFLVPVLGLRESGRPTQS